MGNLLSLNPKIHRLRTNAKILCGFSYCQWIFFWVTSDAFIGLNEHALIHGRSPRSLFGSCVDVTQMPPSGASAILLRSIWAFDTDLNWVRKGRSIADCLPCSYAAIAGLPASLFTSPVARFLASGRDKLKVSLDGDIRCDDRLSLACLAKLRRTGETTGYLKGAGHAVLTTLYSRAHRIGLDGISCLLRGLCASLSLDLFLILIVGVLA